LLRRIAEALAGVRPEGNLAQRPAGAVQVVARFVQPTVGERLGPRGAPMGKRVNYRKLAFDRYDPLCAHCGFGVPAVLEVAHLDGNRSNNELPNLAILCPNCHKMHDLDLISTETIIQMRDRPKVVNWSKRMKDAGQKAALKRLRRAAGRKAAATRRQKVEIAQTNGNAP
jgi:hypothetical protein